MKNLYPTCLLLMLFSVLTNIGLSQSYLDIGAKWTYSMAKYNSSYKAINQIEIIGDTTVNGKQAKIIKRLFFTCDDRPQIDIILEEDNKLFHFDHETGQFGLIFDYNAQQNDTLTIPIWKSLYTTTEVIKIVVDSIFDLQVNGQSIKAYNVTYYGNGLIYPDIILEHIGSMTNLVLLEEGGFCHGFYNRGLRCFEHPTLGTFKFVETDCDFIENDGTAVDDEDLNAKILLSPNPVTDHLQISGLSYPILEYTIYNVAGQILLKGIHENEINTTQLLPGIYHIIMSTKKETIGKSFVKN